jgi:hypothetical protein
LFNPDFNYTEFGTIRNSAGSNIRDYATINELICLSNMENINAVLINEGLPQREWLIKLNKVAIRQMSVLREVESRKLLR